MATYKCDICEREQDKPLNLFLNEKLCLCNSCAEQLHTCRGCENRNNCLVEKNPNNIPYTIIDTVRQGGKIYQIQKPNPKLVEEYCKDCRCYIGETCCRKTLLYCSNWKIHNDYGVDMNEEQ